MAVNRLTSGTVAMTFLSLSHAVSVGGTFALFAGVSVCHFIFTFFLLPETRGKSLEEIEAALGAQVGRKRGYLSLSEEADGAG